MNALYVGRKGFGSELNGEKIKVSPSTDFSDNSVNNSLIVTDVWTNQEPYKIIDLENIRKLVGAGAHGIRSIGSCAMAMCFIASGKGDCYFQHGVHIWDYCGPGLILTEAGGTVVDTGGGDLDLCGRRCIGACSEGLAKGVSEVIQTYNLERD